MKIAIVNQYSSAGGGARFIRALGKALANRYPEDEIGFFTDALNLNRDSFEDLFRTNKNVSVYSLNRIDGQSQVKDIKKKDVNKVGFKRWAKDRLKKIRFIVLLYNFIKFKILKVEDKWYLFSFEEETIKKLEEFDVIYLSWPYFLEPYKFNKPVVGTFHDFNYKHSFGNFAPELLSVVERQTPQWLDISNNAIVSTKFIGNEIKCFYPAFSYKTKVVYVTTFSLTKRDAISFKTIKKKFGLPDIYILSPSNTSKHKNLISVLKALGILKHKGVDIKLVLTGFGTENLALLKPGLKINEKTFSEKIFADYQKVIDKYNIKVGQDIFPLGYISDKDVDSIIDNASLVVSSSLYEAGSGPGVDSWNAETPVAFSNIAPFLEQLDFLGTKAWTFDPKDPEDIAKTIKEAIDSPEKSKQMAKESKEAIDKYTWDNVAEGYHKVFEEAVEK